MKKIVTVCFSLFILVAIAKVLMAQPMMMGEGAVSENTMMKEEATVDNTVTNQVGNAMDEGNAMNEVAAY